MARRGVGALRAACVLWSWSKMIVPLFWVDAGVGGFIWLCRVVSWPPTLGFALCWRKESDVWSPIGFAQTCRHVVLRFVVVASRVTIVTASSLRVRLSVYSLCTARAGDPQTVAAVKSDLNRATFSMFKKPGTARTEREIRSAVVRTSRPTSTTTTFTTTTVGLNVDRRTRMAGRSNNEGLEAALASIQPLRDLSKNWDVDIASW